jgi:hypothetical protein
VSDRVARAILCGLPCSISHDAVVAALAAGAVFCAATGDATTIVVSAATRTKSDGERPFIDLLLTVVKNRKTADPTGAGGSNYVVRVT